MPKKITTLSQLLESKRFIKATNNRVYSELEKQELNALFVFTLDNNLDIFSKIGLYNMFTVLASYEIVNLVERFNFLRENPFQRTKETYICRYGAAEGELRWNQYVEKQRVKNLFDSKKEKYGWSKDQFDEYNKSRSITYKNCIKRHGVKKGKEIWQRYIDRQKYTNSLKYYQEKYGNAGYDEWIKYNHEKGKSTRLEWIIEKYGVNEEEAIKILADRLPKSYSSIAELSFIDLLESAINESLPYTAKTKQFSIWNKYTNSINFYDIVDTNRNKIIEFHGDYWHCNPKLYSELYFHPHLKMLARNIWERDRLKEKAALDRGFKIKIVWWSDYETSPELTIQRTKKWLLSN
jgi:G:T-mismatch repair DNA endonuclease (very short patch repair protein)